jgi:hypothetical protein
MKMGYRSQVASVVYGRRDKMIALLVAEKLQSVNIFNVGAGELVKDLAVHEYSRELTHEGPPEPWLRIDLHGNDWKWYPEYEDVQAWGDFLELAEEMECNYEFMRIGENDDDVETDTGGELIEYHLELERSIARGFHNDANEITSQYIGA